MQRTSYAERRYQRYHSDPVYRRKMIDASLRRYYSNRKHTQTQKECVICGKAFIARKHNNNTCSPEHAAERKRQRDRARRCGRPSSPRTERDKEIYRRWYAERGGREKVRHQNRLRSAALKVVRDLGLLNGIEKEDIK